MLNTTRAITRALTHVYTDTFIATNAYDNAVVHVCMFEAPSSRLHRHEHDRRRARKRGGRRLSVSKQFPTVFARNVAALKARERRVQTPEHTVPRSPDLFAGVPLLRPRGRKVARPKAHCPHRDHAERYRQSQDDGRENVCVRVAVLAAVLIHVARGGLRAGLAEHLERCFVVLAMLAPVVLQARDQVLHVAAEFCVLERGKVPAA